MKRTLALILAVLMTVSCCVFVSAADTVTVTFLDKDGSTVLSTVTVDPAVGLTEVPSGAAASSDGVYLTVFDGWSINGTIVDPTTVEYTDDTYFTAVYKTYGKVYDNPTAQSIPTDTSNEVNFMPEKVDVAADANGITWVYKIDGVTEPIIADNFMVATRNSNAPAWQWDDANYCITGDGTANMMTVENGYYFVYANDNVNGMNGQTANNVINKFSFFAPYNSNYANSQREKVNNNENATFTMLAVINDNLQPTVNFFNGENYIGSYTHKYTDVNKNLSFGTGATQNSSVIKGELVTAADIFSKLGAPAPTKESTDTYSFIFNGWVDENNIPVTAIYDNMDVYASYAVVEKQTLNVTFNDKDGNELASGTVETGTNYAGTIPADQPTWNDGVHTYVFSGWSVDGKNVVDPTSYAYTVNTTFVPVYKSYGMIFEDNDPIALPNGDNLTATDLLPVDKVEISGNTHGVTFVYKVDGVTADIIADDLMVNANGESANPAWAYGDLANSFDNTENAANLTLKNGYYFLFLNRWVLRNGSTLDTVNSFKIFNKSGQYWTNKNPDRVATNTNANATFRMLAVADGNLQPTVTFHDANGDVLGSYRHEYSNSSWANGNKNTHIVKGEIITVDEALALASLTAPEKESTETTVFVFNGWVDAEGNKVEYFYSNVEVYPDYVEMLRDSYKVTFVDKDGNELLVTSALTGGPLASDLPADPASYSDGVLQYYFIGWSVDGKNVVDPVTYNYAGEVTFKPVYGSYGVIYDDPSATDITYNGSAINLLPGKVDLISGATGITFIYKVEGADTEIIADDFRITSNTGDPAWQWDSPQYTYDKMSAANLELNNGYYYMYVNGNLYGGNKASINSFSIYNSHKNHFYDPSTARDPKNDNEAAKFTMLGVIMNNLQPTVTFHGADGAVIGSYTHAYTNVASNLGYGNGKFDSLQVGELLDADDAFAASGIAKPEKAGAETTFYVFSGWVDAEGNEVEAIYTNMDLYPTYTEVEKEEYTVIFLNRDGTTNSVATAFTGEGLTSEYPATLENENDGVYSYIFKGWSIDGKNVVDVATYDYMSDVIFVPVWNSYGVVFEDNEPIAIGDGSAKQDMLPSVVPFDKATTFGATYVYYVEGADETIIADDLYICSKGANQAPTWMWGSTAQSSDGTTAADLELTNGYHYIYINDWVLTNGNLNGTYNFYIFYPHTNHYYDPGTADTPSNTNEGATFKMLAVIPNNLQPTVTFHGADDAVIGSYQHKYTDINKKNSNSANNIHRGDLITVADAFAASGIPTPTKASDDNYFYTFAGWVDAEGNAVEAVYTNMDVYAKFDKTEKTGETYTVTFVDGETELGTYEAVAGESPFFADPNKADDATGYFTFAGWALTADGEAVSLGDIKVEGDMTIYAIFEHTDVTFTVTYYDEETKMYEETVVRSKDAAYGNKPTRPTDTYVEGEDGFYHVFDKWVDAEGNAVDLTNVQADIIVYSTFKDVLVENWWTITWVDSDGETVLDTAVVADGEGASTTAIGKLNNVGTETELYTFAGWDKESSNITADTVICALYTVSDIATDKNVVITESEGTVGTQNDLITDYTFSADNTHITLIFDIKGASEENPVSIGGIRTSILGIDSNNSGNYSKDTAAIRGVTADGKYFVTIGIHLLTWTTNKFSTIASLSIDNAGATRGGKSVGEATYDVVAIEGVLQPTVRFFDEDGNWLYTAKYSYSAHKTTYYFDAVPTARGLYAGPELSGFEAWVDDEGNVVTYVTDNMDVYAKGVHVCNLVATGAGTAECTCGKTSDNAFTIIADPSVEVSELKAGETVKIPVIVNNGVFAGATLKVVTSDNVTLTAIDVAGTLFEGYSAEFGDKIVLNAAMAGENITSDGTIVYLVLTANADIAADETVTVKVSAVEVIDIADEDLTAECGDDYVATYTVATVEEDDVLWGDVNADGAIDGTDAMLLNRYTSGWGESDYADADALMSAGDINADGAIDGTDAMLLNRYTSGWGEDDYADAVNLLKALATLG